MASNLCNIQFQYYPMIVGVSSTVHAFTQGLSRYVSNLKGKTCYSPIQHSFRATFHFRQLKKQLVTYESTGVTKLTVALRLNFESISTFFRQEISSRLDSQRRLVNYSSCDTLSFPLPISKTRGSSSQQSK